MNDQGDHAPEGEPAERGASGTLGVLDIGSQTTTLALFRAGPGRVRRAEQVRVALPLVRHVGPGGRLTPEAVSETARVVGELGRHARRRGCRQLRCVATSAVRDATNAPDVLARLAARCGLVPEILDGRAEGEAAGLAVTSTLPVAEGGFFDLGGGSLQIGRLRDGRCERVESFPLGALRVALEHLRADPPCAGDVDALDERVRAVIAEHAWFGGLPLLVGVGGTIRALAKVDRAAHRWPVRHSHGYWLAADGLDNVVRRLVAVPPRERARLGVPRHRVGSVLSGALVVRALLHATGADGVRVCGFGLRDGVAYQVMGAPPSAPAPRAGPAWGHAVALAEQLREGGRTARATLLTEPIPGWYQEEVVAAGAILGLDEATAAIERAPTFAPWQARIARAAAG